MAHDTIVLKGEMFVLVPEAEYRAITGGLPELPPADKHGNRPAIAFAEAAIARSIIRRRKAVGLSQAALARAAGIRVEILNRAERAVTIPSVRTLTKIEAALATAGAKKPRRHAPPSDVSASDRLSRKIYARRSAEMLGDRPVGKEFD